MRCVHSMVEWFFDRFVQRCFSLCVLDLVMFFLVFPNEKGAIYIYIYILNGATAPLPAAAARALPIRPGHYLGCPRNSLANPADFPSFQKWDRRMPLQKEQQLRQQKRQLHEQKLQQQQRLSHSEEDLRRCKQEEGRLRSRYVRDSPAIIRGIVSFES